MSPFPFSAYLVAAIFGFVIATTVAGALIAILSQRIIRSVAGLALCSLGLAGLYYFLNSPFLALMEILIYVGAVCVTIIFGVMLTETDEPKPQGHPERERWGAAIAALVSIVIFWSLARTGLHGAWPAAGTRVAGGSVQAIGVSLLTTYSLPFELISLVLLVAILGALTLARGGRSKQ
jgi:NADH:ubiquinone oxidoreductase subunit 6 (subunit J)